jgi:RNA polymerase sigma-70 factor (ECF subfamily)
VGSFEIVYKAVSSFVYNVVYRVLYNREDAEEVVQEVFVNIYRNLKNFRFQSSFKTWTYRIAVNCAINYSKKRARQKDGSKAYFESLDADQLSSAPEAGAGMKKERADLILKDLNPDQRACIILRNMEGLSYQEIADTLKVNVNTVRTRLRRAREKLLALRKEVASNEL